jgi:hypothetical protein
MKVRGQLRKNNKMDDLAKIKQVKSSLDFMKNKPISSQPSEKDINESISSNKIQSRTGLLSERGINIKIISQK